MPLMYQSIYFITFQQARSNFGANLLSTNYVTIIKMCTHHDVHQAMNDTR